MDGFPRFSSGDRHLPCPLAAEHAIGGNGKFESHLRATLRLTRQVAGHRPAGFLLQNPDRDFDIGVGKDFQAPAGYPRVRIGDGDHNAGNARGNDGIGARWGLAVMRTGLEGDIGRCPPRLLTCLGNRLRFGMRPTAKRCNTAADDFAIFYDQAADRRIGAGSADMGQGKRDRLAHEGLVTGGDRHASVRGAVAGDLGVDLGDHVFEVLGMGEIPVDRRVAHEGDVIERLQGFEYLQANFFG